MNTAVINVVEVQPPQPGKKRGKVKDTSGALYQAAYPLLSSFQPGGTYSITYKDDSFNGFSFRVIEGMQPAVGAAPTPPPAPMVSTGGTTQNVVREAAQPSLRDEHIFVCGALNASLGNPNMNPAAMTAQQVASLVRMFRTAYAHTFGGKISSEEAMNDEIPF